MLDTLITSKTRVKLLVKFFLNPSSRSYLRSLANEFGESTNAIRLELNKFEQAKLLESDFEGNRKMYKANQGHPFYDTIHKMVHKHLGMDLLIEEITTSLGEVQAVYLTGDLCNGNGNSQFIDLVLVGNNIQQEYLDLLVAKAQHAVNRKVSCAVVERREYVEKADNCNQSELLLLWQNQNVTTNANI